jgi:hypothetical protein
MVAYSNGIEINIPMNTKPKTNPDAIERWLLELDKELDKLAQAQAKELDAALEPDEDEPEEE